MQMRKDNQPYEIEIREVDKEKGRKGSNSNFLF